MKRPGGALVRLCSDTELEKLLQSDDTDLALYAKVELKRRESESDCEELSP